MNIKQLLDKNPIIAAAQFDNLGLAIESKASAVLLMYAKLTELMDQRFQTYKEIKPVFIHTDLLKGLSGDSEGIKFLNNYVKPAGIVSTKGPIIRSAKKEGLIAIQRVFLIDTKSFENTIQSISENNPDAVEIMPGIAPGIIPFIKEKICQPVILAGLISSQQQIMDAINHGADGVSLSNTDLWVTELEVK